MRKYHNEVFVCLFLPDLVNNTRTHTNTKIHVHPQVSPKKINTVAKEIIPNTYIQKTNKRTRKCWNKCTNTVQISFTLSTCKQQ